MLINGGEYRLHLREVHQPSGVWVDIPGDKYSDKETVAVKAGAFVSFRYVRKSVGGFKGELFIYFHGSISVWLSKSALLEVAYLNWRQW